MKITITDNDNTTQLEDNIIQLTDCNNKSFKVNIDDIMDASTVMYGTSNNLTDNVGIDIEFGLTITDSENNIMDEETLIKDVKGGEIAALDVTFEATHSGKNKNHVVYSSDSMETDSKSWLYPFKKPLIKNHDMGVEPIGRVVDSLFGQSEFAPDRDTINVTFRVSDEDAMRKFADGRYKTMSIGASANHISCNTCGKDILKDNKFKFCGHWRGETYANQVATWTTKDLEYKEGSVVNNPADVFAQVKKIRAIKHKDGEDMANTSKDNENDPNVLSDIDNLIDGESTTTEPVELADGITGETGAIGDKGDFEPKDNTEGLTIEDAIKKSNDKILELETSVTTLTDENSELKTELELSKEEVKTSNDALNAANEEIKTVKDQAKRLATFNKKLLIDSLKVLDKDITDETLEGKTAKEISDMIENAKAKPRVIATLENPGAAVKDNNTIIDEGNADAPLSSTEGAKTMKDFEEVVLNFFDR